MYNKYNELTEPIIEYINKLELLIEEIYQSIPTGKRYTITHFTPIFDGITTIVKMIEVLMPKFKIDFDISHVQNVLEQLLNSIENKDFVLIGDILEFELIPVITRYKEEIISINNKSD